MLKKAYQNWRDERLMIAFRRGDQRAFEQLYDRYANRLCGFLFHLIGNYAEAEEISQEAWTAVILHRETFDRHQSFSSWIFTIARRKHIDAWRKSNKCQKRVGQPLTRELESMIDVDAVQGDDYVIAQQLLKEIAGLSDVQKEALLLKLAGFNQNEIAEITQANPETVKSRLRYASRSLKANWFGVKS